VPDVPVDLVGGTGRRLVVPQAVDDVVEADRVTPGGEFRVDKAGSKTLLNCLMYKLCYYRFGSIVSEYGKNAGFDRVRQVEIGNKDFELQYLEEAFTSEQLNFLTELLVSPPYFA